MRYKLLGFLLAAVLVFAAPGYGGTVLCVEGLIYYEPEATQPMPRTCQVAGPLVVETPWNSAANNGYGAMGARASYGNLGAYFTVTQADPAGAAAGGSARAWFRDDLTISGPPGEMFELVIPITLSVEYDFAWSGNTVALASVRDGGWLAWVECRTDTGCRVNSDPFQPLPSGVWNVSVPGEFRLGWWYNAPFEIAFDLSVATGAGPAGPQWVRSWNSFDLTGFHVYQGGAEVTGYDLTTGSGFDYRTLNLTGVPEPGTMWTLAAGLLLCAFSARRATGRLKR